MRKCSFQKAGNYLSFAAAVLELFRINFAQVFSFFWGGGGGWSIAFLRLLGKQTTKTLGLNQRIRLTYKNSELRNLYLPEVRLFPRDCGVPKSLQNYKINSRGIISADPKIIQKLVEK